MNGHIEDANGVMMGTLASRYNVTSLSGSLFTGSHAAKLMKKIEGLLASGYLLLDEYGADQQGTDTDGEEKIEKAEMLLMKITDGDVLLVDTNGNTFLGSASGGKTGGLVSTGIVKGGNTFSVSDQY